MTTTKNAVRVVIGGEEYTVRSELPAGARSVAFRLSFRAPDRTLRDTEIDAIETRMLATLTAELRIQRRVAAPSGGGE